MRQRSQSASRLVANTRVSGVASESRTASTAPSGQFFRYQESSRASASDGDDGEDGDRAVGEPAVERARSCAWSGPRAAGRARPARARGTSSANHGMPADREDRAREREPERRRCRRACSRRRPQHDRGERERGEEIEDERVPARVAAAPLGDELAAEGWIDEQQVVVASGVDRPVRRREQRERREHDERDAA